MNSTTTQNIYLGELVITEKSKNPAMSRNGGEYSFGYYPVFIDGQKVGDLQWTSAGFDYCEITGTFTRCNLHEVEGTDIKFYASRDAFHHLPAIVTAKEFLLLIR